MTDPRSDSQSFYDAWEDAGFNKAELARRLGVTRQGLDSHFTRMERELGIPASAEAVKSIKGAKANPLEAKLIKALGGHTGEMTLIDLSDLVDAAPSRVLDAISDLNARGYNIPTAEEIKSGEPVQLTNIYNSPNEASNTRMQLDFEGDEYEFATVSDVHLCSKHEMVDELHAAYDYIQARGISDVYNPGDLVAGIDIYGRRQINHIHKHTFEDQCDYAEETYPVRDGITTHIIGGNHDLEGAFGRVGANPVKAVCSRREDMKYLGEYSSWTVFPNGAKMHMLHPMGGGAYAKSYKLQKLVESYDEPFSEMDEYYCDTSGALTKPNLLIVGHYHQSVFLPDERNVRALCAGTLERQNELGLRKGLGKPAIGFWIIKVTMGKNGTMKRVATEWMSFERGKVKGV